LMPIVALVLSTIFEEYRWSASAVFGEKIKGSDLHI